MWYPCRSIAGLIQPCTNPHGEIAGHLFLCTHSLFSYLQRIWPQFCFCVVSSSPLKGPGKKQTVCCPQWGLTEMPYRGVPCPSWVQAQLFHETGLPQNMPALPWANQDCPYLYCYQGQNKTKCKEKTLLKLKLENTEGRRQTALPVTKANPEAQLCFLNHLCKKAGKNNWGECVIHRADARKPCCAWLITERLKLGGGISFHLLHGLLPHWKGTKNSPFGCCTRSGDSLSYSYDMIHKHIRVKSLNLTPCNWSRLRCCCLLWIFSFP